MKRIIKKVITYLLVIATVLSGTYTDGLFINEVDACDILYYGDYIYTLNSDNTVTICGYSGSETDVVFPEYIDDKRVTIIDQGDYSKIESAKLPSTLTEIYGFNNYLKHIDMSNCINMQYISDYAFMNYTNLSTIILPPTLERIGYSAFANTGVEELTIPSGWKDVEFITHSDWGRSEEYGVFQGNMKLKKLVIEEGITTIAENAFRLCSLTDISFPTTLRTIEKDAFSFNSELSNIELPEGLQTIESNAFALDFMLKSVHIPSTVKYFSGFCGCVNIEEFTGGEGVACMSPFKYNNYNATGFDHWWFYEVACAGGDETLTIYNRINFIWSTVANDDHEIRYNNLSSIKFDGFQNVTEIDAQAFAGVSSLKSYYVQKSIEKIGDGAFSDCENLEIIDMSKCDKDVEFGESVFSNCTSLKSAILPVNSKKIGKMMFMNCSSLTNVEFPQKLVSIAESAFKHCVSLSELDIPNSVSEIEKNAFEACSNLSMVNFPNNLESIDENAFHECSMLQSLKLPDNLKTIGHSAFSFCNNITTVNFPNNLESIDYEAFCSCDKLECIWIGENLNYIGSEAFCGDYNLNRIVCLSLDIELPEYVFSKYSTKKILIYAFKGSTIEKHALDREDYLTFIPIDTNISGDFSYSEKEDGTLVINGYYGNASNLTVPSTLDGKSVSKIGDEVFLELSFIEKVVIEDGIKEIADTVFYNDVNMKEIIIPESVTKIGNNVFGGCSNELVIKGKRGSCAETYAYANDIVFEELDASETDYKYVYNDDGTLMITEYAGKKSYIEIPREIHNIKVTKIGDRAFSGNNNIFNVIIDDNINELGSEVFKGCQNLDSVEMTDSVVNIGLGTFKDCKNLVMVNLSNSINRIDNEMFSNCINIRSIDIPKGVQTIGYKAFSNCKNLDNVELPDNINRIENYVFSGCSSLANIKYPKNLTEIGAYAFKNCDFEIVNIPYGVVTINEGAYNDCTNLETVVLPSTIEEIYYDYSTSCDRDGNVIVDTNYPCNFGSKRGSVTIYIPENVKAALRREIYIFDLLVEKYDYVSQSGYKFNTTTYEENYSYIKTIADGTCVVLSKCVTNGSKFVVPDTVDGYKVVGIDDNAFEGCKKLEEIECGNGIRFIGNEAFKDCTALKKVNVGNKSYTENKQDGNYITLGSNLFSGCNKIESICIRNEVVKAESDFLSGNNNISVISGNDPSLNFVNNKHFEFDEVNSDGTYDFTINDDFTICIKKYVGNQTSVDIPESIAGLEVTEIGDNSFLDCNVSNVNIPIGVLKIGDNAFYNTKLSNVSIPMSVNEIGTAAFGNCTELEYIYVNAHNRDFMSENGVLYNKNQSRLLVYPALKADKGYIVNSNVIIIDPYAFSQSAYLEALIYSGYTAVTSNTMFYGSKNKIQTDTLTSLTPEVKSVTSVDCSTNEITWSLVAADGYAVFRKPVNGVWEKIATVEGIGTRSYQDTTSKTGKEYYYTVAPYVATDNGLACAIGAYDDDGMKGKTMPTVPVLDFAIVMDTYNRIKWEKVKESRGYYIYRKEGDAVWKLIAKISDGETEFYNDSTADKDKQYSYTVKAYTVDDDGNKVFGQYDKVGIEAK